MARQGPPAFNEKTLGLAQPTSGYRGGADPTASGMAGPNKMKETEIRADTGVSFARATVPEAQIKPAVVLNDAVIVSRSLGTFVVSGEEVWGFFDQTMAYINMSMMTVDFSPIKKDET